MDGKRTIEEQLAAVPEAARQARLQAEYACATARECISKSVEVRLIRAAERQWLAELRTEARRLVTEAQRRHHLEW